MVLSFVLDVRPASAAISDCDSEDCIVSMTNSAVGFYGLDGTNMGNLALGTGTGHMSAKDGHVVVCRFNETVSRIINVATGSSCSVATVGGCWDGTILDGYAYVTEGGANSVKKFPLDCGAPVTINTEEGPNGITTDGTMIYVLNSITGSISEINPTTLAVTNHDLGIVDVYTDLPSLLVYHQGTNSLYLSMGWGVMQVTLPGYTRIDWWDTGHEVLDITASTGYILTETTTGSDAFLIPVGNPGGAMTLPSIGVRGVAMNETHAFVLGGSGTQDQGIKVFDMSNTYLGDLTTDDAWSIAYVKATAAAPFCGDGTRNGTEVCDGADLNGSTCTSRGYYAGTLGCAADCMAFNESACVEFCGNNIADNGEDCDGADLGTETCESLGHDAGSLTCSAGCTYNELTCVDYVCNNGQQEGTEECDGSDLNDQTCESLSLGNGTLACTGGCTFDTTNCQFQPVCGNGTTEGIEECDNGGANSDTTPNACRTDCTNPRCGDSVTDSGEECDDGNTLNSDGCSSVCSIEVPPTCGDGNLDDGEECDDGPANSDTVPDACRTNCTLPACGDNVVDSNEECDGSNNGQSCQDINPAFTGGTLSCNGSCAFDTSGCTTETCIPGNSIEVLSGPIEHPHLIGVALEIYEDNLDTLTPGTCVPVCTTLPGNDEVVVRLDVSRGTYCNVRITDAAWSVILHLYADDTTTDTAILAVPPTHKKDFARFGGAHILLHSGENLSNMKYGFNASLSAGTEGTGEVAKWLNRHPNPIVPDGGEWVELTMVADTMVYCSTTDPGNCGSLITGVRNTGLINLADLGDLSLIGQTPEVPPSENCNGCNQTSGSTSFPTLMLVFIGLIIWLFHVKHRAQSVRVR